MPSPSRWVAVEGMTMIRRLVTSVVIAIALIAAGTLPASGQSADEHDVKAAFLYYFFDLIRWPEGQEKRRFTFCATGDSPISTSLQELLSARPEPGTTVVFTRLSTSTDITACDLIFIDLEYAERALRLISQSTGHAILTVSELEGFAKAGGAIELVKQESRISVRINRNALEQNQLSASARLLALADIIHSN